MADCLDKKSKRNRRIYNILFLLVCGGLFLVLWNAPPETTSPLPHDDVHNAFMKMGKKEAEKHCPECHTTEQMPLPEGHPQPYRCLFCHKRT